MVVLIGALEFDGPYADLKSLRNASGVYAILCENDEDLELIEIGDSDSIRTHLQTHPERELWSGEGIEIRFLVHYTEDLGPQERQAIKETVEREFSDSAAA